MTAVFELFDPKEDVRIQEGTHLPHWYQPGVTYFITFRTEDSIPADVSRLWHRRRGDWLTRHGIEPNGNWRIALQQLSRDLQSEFHNTFSQEFLEYLDRGFGACVLRQPELAQIVSDSLLHFDGQRYHMGDFVVMPNHVHLLVCLLGDTDLEAQCESWKHFTATQINRRLGRRGRLWQEESFDHLVRSLDQFEGIQRYIRGNPDKANLQPGEFLYYERPK